MTINFHDKKNKLTYATREADYSWKELIKQYMSRDYITALDIGCGGGIYSKALAQMGVRNVIGMDFSESNLDGARENCESFRNIKFIQGDALNTGLSDNYVDLILERALIHHIKDIMHVFRKYQEL
jgi:ubiquinone/menaquinone biosynthesis C-methylase UbiE